MNLLSHYLIFVPLGKLSTDTSSNNFFLEPAKIIPCDYTPLKTAGFKLDTTITFLPIISSGL